MCFGGANAPAPAARAARGEIFGHAEHVRSLGGAHAPNSLVTQSRDRTSTEADHRQTRPALPLINVFEAALVLSLKVHFRHFYRHFRIVHFEDGKQWSASRRESSFIIIRVRIYSV